MSKINHLNRFHIHLLKFILTALVTFTGAGWLVFHFVFFLMGWSSQGIPIWIQLLLGVITGFVAFVVISPLVLRFLESRRRHRTYHHTP
jgi:membrane protein implicated in regulation of membrane protease activity